MSKRWYIPERATLIGGFICDLTSEELNQWNEYVSELSECKLVHNVDRECAALTAEVSGGALDKATDLRIALAALAESHNRLYDIGKNWYAELVAKEEAKKAAGVAG